MRQSQLFTKTRKEAPKDEVAKNAQLLIRAGFVDKLQAGVYTYLPLGFLVFKKIENIIREEMNKAGGQEILMPSLHPKENWEKTGRWDTMDDLYKVKDSSERENALGATHEEVVVPLAKKFIHSYKDLPFSVYQIQNKFRMELRAKSGILRGREFIMKDFYSFHKDEKDLADFYEKMKGVYKAIFERVGIGEKTYLTFASGGSFSKYSHEFQTATDAGEDIIYVCNKCSIAINKEIKSEQKSCPECGGENFEEKKSIEVGNIFELKTRYSDPFELTYKDEDGSDKPVMMGCYGIGLGRLLGTIVEVYNDENGIIWPEAVAPFKAHILAFYSKDEEKNKRIVAEADRIYESLQSKGVDVFYDDRKDISFGEKLKDADLIGIPEVVIISEKTLEKDSVEVKKRGERQGKLVNIKEYAK
ncbi:prolyl-tRNA synthetase [Candidatus Azambacteria bacterium]|nr:prolyl-tRNA synthetase [Candidatus Azambacteria bacterium]